MQHRAAPPQWVLGEAPGKDTGGKALTVLPGSSGVAEGPVFVVLSTDDFPNFPKGAVLAWRRHRVLSRLKNGQRVRVDGGAGTVLLLD